MRSAVTVNGSDGLRPERSLLSSNHNPAPNKVKFSAVRMVGRPGSSFANSFSASLNNHRSNPAFQWNKYSPRTTAPISATKKAQSCPARRMVFFSDNCNQSEQPANKKASAVLG